MTDLVTVYTAPDGGRNFVCHYCLATFPWSEHTWDHIVPRSRGGRDAQWNLVHCCRPCNLAKSNDVPGPHCEQCIEAIARHPTAFLSARRGVMFRVAEEWDDPEDCVWCRYIVTG